MEITTDFIMKGWKNSLYISGHKEHFVSIGLLNFQNSNRHFSEGLFLFIDEAAHGLVISHTEYEHEADYKPELY